MRIVPLPADEPLPGQEAWVAELEAALRGESQRPDAHAWRELRDDVRALAPTMTPAFEARIAQELERCGALAGDAGTGMRSQDDAASSRQASAGDRSSSRSVALARGRRGLWSLASHRRSAVGAAAGVAIALVVALVISGSHGLAPVIESGAPARRTPAAARGHGARGAKAAESSSTSTTPGPSAGLGGSSASAVVRASPSIGASGATGAFSASGRVQQLAASITLDSSPQNLQAISDRVAQLTARDGGYVQSSNVEVQQAGASEATLALRLPSARLAPALAAIERLAPVRAANQSLQDITDAYRAAHQQLRDAEAEQRALLRALAAASTETQIDSLHARLAASRAAIARAQSSVNSISARASTSEVEVSILGDTRAGKEGVTLHKGLRDAGQVLLVVVIAILVLAAVLVPLALLLAGVAGTRRTWRRYQRDRVLNTP
jgi:Domain of unknown function (DUF4349)